MAWPFKRWVLDYRFSNLEIKDTSNKWRGAIFLCFMKVRNTKLTLINKLLSTCCPVCDIHPPLTTPAFAACFIAVSKHSFCKTEPVLSVYVDLGNPL